MSNSERTFVAAITCVRSRYRKIWGGARWGGVGGEGGQREGGNPGPVLALGLRSGSHPIADLAEIIV